MCIGFDSINKYIKKQYGDGKLDDSYEGVSEASFI